MLHPIVRRWFAGLGAFVAAVAVTPGTPALAAAPERPVIHVSDLITTPGVHTSGNIAAEYPGGVLLAEKITFDVTEVAGFGEFQPNIYGFHPYDCATTGTVVACTTDAPSAGQSEWIQLLDYGFTPHADAAPGSSGKIKIQVQTGATTTDAVVAVNVTEPVNLAALELPEYTAVPGETINTPFAVKNIGDTTVDGFYLVYSTSSGVDSAERYSNCQYQKILNQWEPRGATVHCAFDGTIEPGQTVRVPDSFGFTIAQDSWAPLTTTGFATWFATEDYEGSNWGEGPGTPSFEQGDGPVLTLEPVTDVAALRVPQQDPDQYDNGLEFTIEVTGDQQADAVAIGATVTADRGDTVTATVGVRNAGPARLNNEIGGWLPYPMVSVPEGTTVVSADPLCRPILGGTKQVDWQFGEPGHGGAELYLCWPGKPMPAGETVEFPFELKVEGDFATSTAPIELFLSNVQAEGEGKDLNAENNIAELVVNSNGTGTVGGGGEGGGTLPITGAKAGLIGAAGAALLAAGIAGFLLARRRRTAFVA